VAEKPLGVGEIVWNSHDIAKPGALSGIRIKRTVGQTKQKGAPFFSIKTVLPESLTGTVRSRDFAFYIRYHIEA
jgi:hypothetical protein